MRTPRERVPGAKRVTLILAAIAYWAGLAYSFPEAILARPKGYTVEMTQQSLVVVIESFGLGIVWPLVFFSAGTALVLAATFEKWVGIAYSLGAGAWGFYGSAVLLSASLYEPPRSLLMGGISIGAALIHLAMIRVWSDRGVK